MLKQVIIDKINPVILICWLASLVFEKEYKLMTTVSTIFFIFNIYLIRSYIKKSALVTFCRENKLFLISFLIFIFANSITDFFIDYNSDDLKFTIDFIKYSLFLMFPFFLIQNIKSLYVCMVGCSVILTFFSLNGIYEYFVLNLSRAGEIPTLYAYVLMLLFPLGIVYFKLANSNNKIYFIISFLTLISLSLTQTRACWIACFIGLCITAYLYKDIIKFINVKKICIAALVLILFSSPILFKRVQDTINYKNSYSVERLYIWESAYKMGIDFFWTGIGHDRNRFKELYNSQYQLPESNEKGIIHPHNVFLNFFVKSGIFGLISYVFFQIMQLKYFSKTVFSKNEILKVLSVIGIWFFIVNLIGGCFEAYFHFIKMQKIYWVILGIIIVGIELVKNKDSNQNINN